MSSNLLQLISGSRDLSQAETILNMTTIFTQNDNFVWQFWVSFCEFTQLYIKVILFSAWEKSRDARANWSKLEQMESAHEVELQNVCNW